MPASTPQGVSITKPQQENLEHLSHILHLFNHRNKNQHRRSIWYRHFSTFRKQLDLLISDISSLNTSPSTHLERSRKKKRDEELKALIQRRRDVWQEVFVEKWYSAFSQLVADNQYAVMGVVLVGVLGEVCGVLGVTREFEREGDEAVREAIERFGREVEEDGGLAGRLHGDGDGGEDVGVAVRREVDEEDGGGTKRAGSWEDLGFTLRRTRGDGEGESAVGAGGTTNDTEMDLSAEPISGPSAGMPTVAPKTQEGAAKATDKRTAPSTKTTVAKKTKKRKKGDAIDDLFSGLG